MPEVDPRKVSAEELGAVLQAAYGLGRADRPTVPSAGGLHPLVLHVILREPLPAIRPGVWWYDWRHSRLRLVAPEAPEADELFLAHPVSDAILRRRQPVIFLSADMGRVERKYANRGYRFALMETGAAMQNAYLAAAELGLPIRAIGGFRDIATQRALGVSDVTLPFLALLLGA
jgi:SagB-type dehydrogenase family enzyme